MTETKRIIYYYQTFNGLGPLLSLKSQPCTHIHLASIHFGVEKDGKTPYIHLNNNHPNDPVFDNLWKPTDIFNEEKTIEEIQSIKPILKETTSSDEFNTIRVLTHSLHWKQNVGRNLKYIVVDETGGKYLGLITIASDVVSIQSRDEKIGWNNENKFKQKKINNSAIASTIVPTQPLGFNFLGTKLIACLTTLDKIKNLETIIKRSSFKTFDI